MDTCTSSVTMRKTCVSEPMTSSRHKHNCKSKVSTKNDKPLIHGNAKCAAGVKASQIQSNVAGNALHLGLPNKGLNFGHWNIQKICGKDMCKFSEIKATLTVNKNVHVLGFSETKLKEHKFTSMFHVEGYQTPFRKDNYSNGGGGIIVYVKNIIYL